MKFGLACYLHLLSLVLKIASLSVVCSGYYHDQLFSLLFSKPSEDLFEGVK